MTNTARKSWSMFAHDYSADGIRFRHVYDNERATRFASPSRPTVQVIVTEDPAGGYHA